MVQLSAVIGSPVHTAILSTIKELKAMKASGRFEISGTDVMSLIDDVCLDTRTRLADLPISVFNVWNDAKERLESSDNDMRNLRIGKVIESLERA